MLDGSYRQPRLVGAVGHNATAFVTKHLHFIRNLGETEAFNRVRLVSSGLNVP